MRTGKKSLISKFISDFRRGFSTKYAKNQAFFAKKHTSTRRNFSNAYKISRASTCKNLSSAYKASYKKVYFPVNNSKIIRFASVAIISFLIGYFAGLTLNPTNPTNALTDQGEKPTYDNSSLRVEPKNQPAQAEFSTIREQSVNSEQVGPSAASLLPAATTMDLYIPAINFSSSVIQTYVNENNDVVVPASTIGALNSYRGTTFHNKTLLVGHRASIFSTLPYVKIGDEIIYHGKTYIITQAYYQSVSLVESKMRQIIKDEEIDTLILMTCAGVNNSDRFIVTAITH